MCLALRVGRVKIDVVNDRISDVLGSYEHTVFEERKASKTRSPPFIVVEDTDRRSAARFIGAWFLPHGIRWAIAVRAHRLNDISYVPPQPPQVDAVEVVVDCIVSW
jgi:hypothetical protein